MCFAEFLGEAGEMAYWRIGFSFLLGQFCPMEVKSATARYAVQNLLILLNTHMYYMRVHL